MLRTYLDESHQPKIGIFAVGGYAFDPGQSVSFAEAWSEVLASESLSEFHMVDFAHSVGEFAAWRGDEERRIGLLKRLASLIQAYARFAVVAAIDLKRLAAVAAEEGWKRAA